VTVGSGDGEEMAVWKQMRHQTALFGAIGTVVATTLLLAGCSASTTVTAPSASPSLHTKTYANRQFGFAISYDTTRFSERVDAVISGPGTYYDGPPRIPVDSILIDVLVKPAGYIQTAWDGPGGVQIDVLKASRTIPPPTLAALRQASKKYFLGDPLVPLTRVKTPGLVIGQWQPFRLNGLHGFTVTVLTAARHQVFYELWNGKLVYGFVIAASKSAWPRVAPMLRTVVQSLRVIQ
jgi:hypothetical protein